MKIILIILISLNLYAGTEPVEKKDQLIQALYNNEILEINGKVNKNVINPKIVEFLKESAETNPNSVRALYLIKENNKYDPVLRGEIDKFLLEKSRPSVKAFNEPVASVVEEMISFTEGKDLTKNGISKEWYNFLEERVKQEKMSQSTIESLFEIRRRRSVPAYSSDGFRKKIMELLKEGVEKSDIVARHVLNVSKNLGRTGGFGNEVLLDAGELIRKSPLPTDSLSLMKKIEVPHVESAVISRAKGGSIYLRSTENRIYKLAGKSEGSLVRISHSLFRKVPGLGTQLKQATSFPVAVNIIEGHYNLNYSNPRKPQEALVKRLAEIVDMRERMRMIDILITSQDREMVNKLSEIYKKVARSTKLEEVAVAKKINEAMETIIMEGLGVSKLPSGEIVFNKLPVSSHYRERLILQIDHDFMTEAMKKFIHDNVVKDDIKTLIYDYYTKKPTEKSLKFLKDTAEEGNEVTRKMISNAFNNLSEKTTVPTMKTCLREYALKILK